MSLNKRCLKNCKLYLILDTEVHSYTKLFEIAKQSIQARLPDGQAGVDIIQLRDKNGLAKDVLKFSKQVLRLTEGKVPFIINDRVDVAILCGADGVHLGQEDIPLKEARKVMGPKVVIGVSCQTFKHAQKAQREGADYIGFGSIFKTLTKPKRSPIDLNLLKEVIKKIHIPVFAIGGVNLDNIRQLKEIGVERFAVCRAICEAENVREVVREFKLRG